MKEIRMFAFGVATWFCFAVASPPAIAVVWNVDPFGTGDVPTIQAAYDAASAGDIILLAPGTYQDSNTRVINGYFPTQFPSTTAVAFMKAGVSLESSGGANSTVIDGESVRHGLIGADVNDAAIRGVTLYRCTTAGTFGGTEIWGGGVLVYRSRVTIEDCRFVECKSPAGAGGGGGGLFLADGSNAVIRRNLFLRGFSSQLGGAIEAYRHSSLLIENNTFVDNDANDAGGAVLLNSTTGTVDRNIFSGNFAGARGGAVGCISPTAITGSCNLFWMNLSPAGPDVSDCGVIVGQQNNLVADPLFCDANGEYFAINSASPANPGHPSGCGLRGAYGVGCGPVSVESLSWGRIKGLYSKE